MLKEPALQQYQFERVTLEEQLPEDPLACAIDVTIGFEFIRDFVSAPLL